MGRRATLSRERILHAALRLVDRAGLEALTMRRLAKELGVEAMSLYRYVRGKEDVLDGVHELILQSVPAPPARGSWKQRLGVLARGLREVLLAHPNAVPLFATRPAVAEGSLARADAVLGILHRAGFRPADQLAALHGLIAYVVGSVLSVAAWPGPGRSGVDYAALPEDAFPNLRRLAPVIAQEDPEYEFTVGLEAFLAGLDRLRRARRR